MIFILIAKSNANQWLSTKLKLNQINREYLIHTTTYARLQNWYNNFGCIFKFSPMEQDPGSRNFVNRFS